MRLLLCMTFAFLFSAACKQAPVGVKSADIPSTSAQTCSRQCEQVELTLDSLVIMAGRIGCVCRAAPLTPPAAGGQSAALASIILDDEEAAAQQQQRNRRSSPPQQKR